MRSTNNTPKVGQPISDDLYQHAFTAPAIELSIESLY